MTEEIRKKREAFLQQMERNERGPVVKAVGETKSDEDSNSSSSGYERHSINDDESKSDEERHSSSSRKKGDNLHEDKKSDKESGSTSNSMDSSKSATHAFTKSHQEKKRKVVEESKSDVKKGVKKALLEVKGNKHDPVILEHSQFELDAKEDHDTQLAVQKSFKQARKHAKKEKK